MARLVTTATGIGRLHDGSVVLLDLPYDDLGQALAAGAQVAEIADAPPVGTRPLDEVQLRAPIPRPPTIWALGWGWRTHREESGRADVREEPFFFLKSPASVIGPGQPIELPDEAPDRVDYEGEIAVVIGRQTRDVPADQALAQIAGYTIANDVSARDVQKGDRPGRPANVNLAKSFDTFTPLGPCLSTLEEFDDPDDVAIETVVDGEVRQQATSADLVHPVGELIAYLSRYTTLVPGDVVLTGTPGGVGFAQGRFLADGSAVSIRVSGVGVLENPVVRRTHRPTTDVDRKDAR